MHRQQAGFARRQRFSPPRPAVPPRSGLLWLAGTAGLTGALGDDEM